MFSITVGSAKGFHDIIFLQCSSLFSKRLLIAYPLQRVFFFFEAFVDHFDVCKVVDKYPSLPPELVSSVMFCLMSNEVLNVPGPFAYS